MPARLLGQAASVPPRNLASKSQRWIVAQSVSIVMVAPLLRDQHHASPDQRGEIVRDVDLAARILQARRHPDHDAAPFQYLAQQHRAGVTRRPVGAAFDAKRAVERRDDSL